MCNPQVDTVVFTGVEEQRNFYTLTGESRFACRGNTPPPPPIKCTHTSASGDQYDLSALQAAGPFNVVVDENPGLNHSSHSVGICALSEPCPRALDSDDSSSCQTDPFDDQYSNGKLSTLKMDDLTAPFGVKGVVLSYSDKGHDRFCVSSANPEGERRTVVEIICSAVPISPDPILKFIAEGPKCVYNFALESTSACPSSSQNATVM
jgi:hypothetical protein